MYNYEAKISESATQMESTGRHEHMSVPCMADGATVAVNSTTVTSALIDSLRFDIWMYATGAALLQCFLIYFSNQELKKFDHILALRYADEESQGQNLFSYAKQFSFIVNVWTFLLNFGLFMIYFTLSLVLGDLSWAFVLPLVVQFVLLFFFSNRLLIYQLKIMAYDKFDRL